VPSDLVQLPAAHGLPELGDVDIMLLTSPRAPQESADALTAAILSNSGRTVPTPGPTPEQAARARQKR
jgi:hypothetical protein